MSAQPQDTFGRCSYARPSLKLSDTGRPQRGSRTALFVLTWLLLASASWPGEPAFPLRPSAGHHYLEDQKGKPFLLTGDSAWSLIADVSTADAEFYLDIRKRQGFNTVLTSLIEHQFSRNAPADFYGQLPFEDVSFGTPNEAYFARAEDIIQAAARRNMMVLLCPAYLGAGGGPEGWYLEMVAAGPERLKAYGRYIGRRFARYKNIIWLQGGDYDPHDMTLVPALAQGVAEGDPDALQTIHANRDTVTHVLWKGADWLKIDTVYTYDDVADVVFDRFLSGPRRPFFLIEGKYEGEHGVGDSEARLIAYSALLSGAGGQIYGNNPVWHFGGPGLFQASEPWKQALSSAGARSITALQSFFLDLEWWKLRPDRGLLPNVGEDADGEALAAVDVEGRFAVIYARDLNRLALDLNNLSPGTKTLRWYDPSSGSFLNTIHQFRTDGIQHVALPQQPNGGGFRDWVGLLSISPGP